MRKMGSVPDSVAAKRSFAMRDCPHYSGFTLVEIIMVIAIFVVITGTAWLSLKGFWLGRSVEMVSENLVNLIKTAQATAKETESVQKILFSKDEAVWTRNGETVRTQKFKNEVKIKELELANGLVEVPDEPIEDVGILIDEKGSAESGTIVLARGRENTIVSVGGSIVTAGGGSVGIIDGTVVAQFIEQPESGEDALIFQTEPLQVRGWQVINVNNIDKVKEVRVRVNLDSKLPASAHLHAYVFPGWYENKPAAHGVTGQQTMAPSPLYRESTEDCLAFFRKDFTVSGTLMKENGGGVNGKIKVDYILQKYNKYLQRLDFNFGHLTLQTTNNGSFYETFGNDDGFTLIGLDVRYLPNPAATLYIYNPSNYSPQAYIWADFKPLPQNIPNLNFIVWNYTLSNNINGTVNGPSNENVLINIQHIPDDFTPFYPNPDYPPLSSPDGARFIDTCKQPPTNVVTKENGNYSVDLTADHSYELRPSKEGCVFEPAAVTVFLDSNKTQNFVSRRDTPFIGNQSSFGDWSYNESEIQSSAILVNVPVFSNQVSGYYIYKNKVVSINPVMQSYSANQVLPMYDKGIDNLTNSVKLHTILTPNNTLNPCGYSDFPTKNAELIADMVSFFVNNAHWERGYVYSSFANQSTHFSKQSAEEIKQCELSEWLTIPVSSLPPQTKFIRIAIALYHQTSSSEELLNLAPTVSSTHPNQTTIPISQFDYELDPFIVHYPWANYINDPFWLSHYAYAMKPILRPYGVNVLAVKGPITGENYKNTGRGYKGFWYGPLYLDWDLILGQESLYGLIGWTTGAYELINTRWKFSQQGDCYEESAYAPSSHYLLKNFAYLSYWYLFEYAIYNESSDQLPKRFQHPFVLSIANSGRLQEKGDSSKGVAEPPQNLFQNQQAFYNTASYGWMKIFERPDPTLSSYPRESSNLSIPFLANPLYPPWKATIPAIFGQGKITNSPDLYSSYYYLQERINHIMLDIGIWTFLTNQSQQNRDLAKYSIFGLGTYSDPGGDDVYLGVSPTLGNFEVFSIGGETLASWWRWYQEIPWAKGQAFPKKTGPAPTNYVERAGWERPVISQPSSYWDYFASSLISYNYRANPTTSYNAVQVVNAPHTIFMSTSHYPLGTIQIAVKKK